MSKRRRQRKNKNSTPQSRSSTPARSPDPAILSQSSAGAVPEDKKISVLTHVFKDALENVATKLKERLNQKEKMGPMAFFFGPDGTMQTVSFHIKDEFQKEVLISRMREKVIAENIRTVLVLTETNEHYVAISGASHVMTVSARIDFDPDEPTSPGVPAEWRIKWLKSPVQNALLDPVFNGNGQ